MDRNKQIILCYRAGNTMDVIASAFGISKQRVHQLLQRAGVTRQENPATRNRELYAFIGANVTKEVKALAVREAKRRHMSLSGWVSRVLQDELSHNMGEEQ
jgi:hypothetical protein